MWYGATDASFVPNVNLHLNVHQRLSSASVGLPFYINVKLHSYRCRTRTGEESSRKSNWLSLWSRRAMIGGYFGRGGSRPRTALQYLAVGGAYGDAHI